MSKTDFWQRVEERKKRVVRKERRGGEIPPYLHRDAKCPICGKYLLHRDIWDNPIPKSPPHRRLEDCCQCPRGKFAREERIRWTTRLEQERRERRKRAQEALSLEQKRKAYWEQVELRKQHRRVREGGELTAGMVGTAVKGGER